MRASRLPLLLLLLPLLALAAAPAPVAARPDREGKGSAGGKLVVCVDPGHPSETSDGRWKANGISELEAVWETALLVKAQLEAAGFAAPMTKGLMDQFVTNRERAEIANRGGASLFLRLHCDTGKRRGFTVYHPDRPGKKDGVTGPSPEVIRESGIAAQALFAGMAEALAGRHPGLGVKGDSQTAVGAKQGALTGSIYCEVPSVLVEMANLPNKEDAAFMKDPASRSLLAGAIVSGTRRALEALAAAPASGGTAAPTVPGKKEKRRGRR